MFHQNKYFGKGLVVLCQKLKELFNFEISKMDPVHPVHKVTTFFIKVLMKLWTWPPFFLACITLAIGGLFHNNTTEAKSHKGSKT